MLVGLDGDTLWMEEKEGVDAAGRKRGKFLLFFFHSFASLLLFLCSLLFFSLPFLSDFFHSNFSLFFLLFLFFLDLFLSLFFFLFLFSPDQFLSFFPRFFRNFFFF